MRLNLDALPVQAVPAGEVIGPFYLHPAPVYQVDVGSAVSLHFVPALRLQKTGTALGCMAMAHGSFNFKDDASSSKFRVFYTTFAEAVTAFHDAVDEYKVRSRA